MSSYQGPDRCPACNEPCHATEGTADGYHPGCVPSVEIHVTRVSSAGVYGHATRHCDPSGCAAGADVYYAGLAPDAVECHRVYEIDAATHDVIAEVES